MEVRVLVQ